MVRYIPYAGQVMLVPTTNFILKWSVEATREHQFDENLTEVSLITEDAFEPTLPLSVVVHIDYKKAPLVVQRFGDIKTNEGRAALAFAQQDAERVKVEAGANAARVKLEAEASAERLRLEGESEAKKVEQVGLAQARATQAQVNAFGGPQYQLTQQVMARFAEAVERGHVDIVPKVMVGGGAPDGKHGALSGNLLGALMAMMLVSKADTELREGGLMR
jgi:uncharacterized membrane protein YqiK